MGASPTDKDTPWTLKNSVVIMTSNVGSDWIRDLSGRDEAEMRRRVMEALRQTFRPEFLNRVDETIIFHSLDIGQIVKIVDIQLADIEKRLAERKIGLRVTPAAKEYLANEGFDPVYGARPLKRTIQRQVMDPLAVQVLEGRFVEGDTVLVDREGAEIVFHKASSEPQRVLDEEPVKAVA